MASGLIRLKARKFLPTCVKHSIFNPGLSRPGWRTVMSIAFNPENGFPEALSEKKMYRSPTKSLDVPSLKQREKGDWRSLSVDEKRTLYRMSFNQPFPEVTVPADDWKPILGGTFAAMGLMTMGIYIWLTQSVYAGHSNGSLSAQCEHPSELLNMHVGENVDPAFDCRH